MGGSYRGGMRLTTVVRVFIKSRLNLTSVAALTERREHEFVSLNFPFKAKPYSIRVSRKIRASIKTDRGFEL